MPQRTRRLFKFHDKGKFEQLAQRFRTKVSAPVDSDSVFRHGRVRRARLAALLHTSIALYVDLRGNREEKSKNRSAG